MPNNSTDNVLMLVLGASVGIFIVVISSQMFGEEFGFRCPNQHLDRMSKYNRKKQIIQQVDQPIHFDDLNDEHHKGGDAVAKDLAKTNRILCWVMTAPDTIKSRGKAVMETWGKRCNTLLFMSSEEDKTFPAVCLDLPGGRRDKWSKTRAAWKYVYENHINDADWFLKADDETFVIVENLRLLVSRYNTEDRHYFGRWYKTDGEYHSEGAGYVFSRATLKAFREVMIYPNKCSEDSLGEEGNVGSCLAAAGIHPDDSRDFENKEAFHPFPPEKHVVPINNNQNSWLHQYNKFPVVHGPGCCSKTSVTFNNINFQMMYILEYLVYHLRPYGIQKSLQTQESNDKN